MDQDHQYMEISSTIDSMSPSLGLVQDVIESQFSIDQYFEFILSILA